MELTGLQHSSVGGGGGGGGPSTPVSIANGGTFATSYTTGTVLYYDGTRFVSSPIFRVSANSTEQRNSTNAQSAYWYNTFTDSSNYERGKLSWSSNVLQIGTEAAGTGTARNVELQTGGTTRLTISSSSVAAAVPVSIVGGTVTASTPSLSISQTWNNGAVTFNSIALDITNTASATASTFINAKVGGVTQFSVSQTGTVSFGVGTGGQICYVQNYQGALVLGPHTGQIWFGSGGTIGLRTAAELVMSSNASLKWSQSANNFYASGLDVELYRVSAQFLALKQSTSACTFGVHNTWTDASNYERGKFGWASNVLQIGTEAAGTGSARDLVLGTGTTFTERLRVNSSGLTIADAHNVVLDTTTGTKIGTATTQKLGFWNVTPIVQPASANQATITDSTGGTPGSSLVDVTATPTQTAINNNFATINVLLLAIRTALVDSGIMKGAA